MLTFNKIIFLVQLTDTSRFGCAFLSFSPCYLCEPVYVNEFCLALNGASRANLRVNGKIRRSRKTFNYELAADNPAEFLVQTTPKKGGRFNIKAQYKKDDNTYTLYDYTTVVGQQEASAPANDGLAPFGST